MFKVKWDQIGERYYETGVDRAVVYPFADGVYANGEGWNGLTAVNENPSGAEPTPLYANNHKYLELMSAEEFGFTIEAYIYPDAFAKCNGESELAKGVNVTQQDRQQFGLTYRNIFGNDTEKNEHGYKIHLVYGAMASPSEKSHSTVNEDPEVDPMSWECTTTPVEVPGFKPTAHIVINSTQVDAAKLAALEDILYGKAGAGSDGAGAVEPRLPLPSELITIFNGSTGA